MTGAEVALGAGVAFSVALSVFNLWRQERSGRTRRRPSLEAPSSTGGGIRNVGIVRFNPYHDTGGDYSFAVALLDGSGTGVLLTGLYHRDQCRVYAKPISGWGSSYALTGEEREAIERSRGEDESETACADRL